MRFQIIEGVFSVTNRRGGDTACFWRAGSDNWCRTVQSVNNQHAAVWDMFFVFFFLKGGVSLPRFVSDKKGQMHFGRVAGIPLRLVKTNSRPVA